MRCMTMLDSASLLTHAVIIGFAALVHGTIGIGFPLIATPLLALMTDVRTAILMLVLPTMVLNLANILKGGRWNLSIAVYWPLAVYGMIGSLIGTRLLIVFSPDPFLPLMAAMLVIYLNAERLGAGFAWVHNYPRIAIAVFGLTAGILAGTVNVMLPVLVIFALEMRMSKTVMIQVLNFCFLFGKLTQGVVLVQAGLITAEVLTTSVPLALLGLVVMFFGMHIRERIPTEVYRYWLRKLLALLAVMLMVQFFWR